MLQSLPLPSRIKENIPIEWRDLWKLWFLIIVIQHLPRISGWKDKHFRWRIIHFLPPRLCYDLYDLIIFIVSIRLIIIADHCCCGMIRGAVRGGEVRTILRARRWEGAPEGETWFLPRGTRALHFSPALTGLRSGQYSRHSSDAGRASGLF